MGNSASADIFFGIVICDSDEESLAPWGEESAFEDFEEWATATLSDIKRPQEEYPERNDTSAEAQRIKALFSDFWKKKRDFMESLEVESDHIGYMDGYSTEVLKLKGWGIHAGYGPDEIDLASLVLTDEHRKRFAEAITRLGIPNLPEPSVMMGASWG